MSIETFKQVDGRRVIASDSAESIGTVKGFVLDAAGRQIESVHIDGRGKNAHLVAWSTLSSFGADAVMVPSEADRTTVDDGHQKAAVKGNVAMVGSRVLTSDGLEVGVVDDVDFDTETGAIVRVITDHGPIEASRVRSLGSYALVVDAADALTP